MTHFSVPQRLGLAALLFAATPASAQTAEIPSIVENDAWVYQVRDTQGLPATTVTYDRQYKYIAGMADGASVMIGVGAPEPAANQIPTAIQAGHDWSSERGNGAERRVIERPFSFPLYPGKTWEVVYSTKVKSKDPAQADAVVTTKRRYKAVQWEDVVVPAGAFRAMRIEQNVEYSKPLAANIVTAAGDTGAAGQNTIVATTKEVAWYAPEVKAAVKFTEEYAKGRGVVAFSSIRELKSSTVKRAK